MSPPSPDRARPWPAEPAEPAAAPGRSASGATDDPLAANAGWLEFALPLWHRKWIVLLAMVLGVGAGFGLSLLQPVRFTGSASVLVQPALRPSQSVVASGLPALAHLVGGGGSPVDLHVTILRSQTVSDRILDRFDLQRSWNLRFRTQARQQLARRVSFGIGRRDGLVQIVVEDDHPQRAAAIANEYINELRAHLRGYALVEARQRRQFFEEQLARARIELAQAQQQMQRAGFDRAAMRSQPNVAAERYARLAAEVAAAEMRLAAARRVRAEGSAEVQQQLAELAQLRGQLAAQQAPRDEDSGAFVSRLREFRYAETLVESLVRQVEAARVDEAGDATPFQVLDLAQTPEWPSSPRIVVWAAVGGLLGGAFAVALVLLRHRLALARLDPQLQERVALIRSVLPGRRQ